MYFSFLQIHMEMRHLNFQYMSYIYLKTLYNSVLGHHEHVHKCPFKSVCSTIMTMKSTSSFHINVSMTVQYEYIFITVFWYGIMQTFGYIWKQWNHINFYFCVTSYKDTNIILHTVGIQLSLCHFLSLFPFSLFIVQSSVTECDNLYIPSSICIFEN